jgi:hypothetical protein
MTLYYTKLLEDFKQKIKNFWEKNEKSCLPGPLTWQALTGRVRDPTGTQKNFWEKNEKLREPLVGFPNPLYV